MEKIHWIKFLTFKYSFYDVSNYLLAKYRLKCYYNHLLAWLIRPHIKEQINFRVEVMMDKECYYRGQCKLCGCATPDLQFANKTCEGNCYPPLVGRLTWQQFAFKGSIVSNDVVWSNTRYILPTSKESILIRKLKSHVG